MSKRSVALELKSRVRVKEEWNESDSRVECEWKKNEVLSTAL